MKLWERALLAMPSKHELSRAGLAPTWWILPLFIASRGGTFLEGGTLALLALLLNADATFSTLIEHVDVGQQSAQNTDLHLIGTNAAEQTAHPHHEQAGILRVVEVEVNHGLFKM